MLCRVEPRAQMLALQEHGYKLLYTCEAMPRVISLVLACCGIIATRETAYFRV